MGHKKLSDIDHEGSYPEFLKKAVGKQRKAANEEAHPVLIKMDDGQSEDKLQEIVQSNSGVQIVDNYDEQYAELLLSKNAHLYRAKHEVQTASIKELLEEHYGDRPTWKIGSWVYFPWGNELVHILHQDDFEDLRTIRNRDLISRSEQKKLFQFEIVNFGMSVGSAGALACGISGISRRMKLVDGAVISGSNLNRILTGVSSVGTPKATVIGRQIYEMNPYSEITHFDKASEANIDQIFDKPWKVMLAIDEIDDIEMKVRIRYEARKRGIPVIMATELGDTVMLDVERFDLEPNRPLFHGLIPDIEKILEEKLENYREWTKHAVRIIDPKNMTVRMQKSLLKIGSSIVTHPQLGSTVMMTGGVLAFAAKSIALGNPIESGRYIISLEKELLTDHRSRSYKKTHKKHTKVMQNAIDAM